jgi:hypothetical protein
VSRNYVWLSASATLLTASLGGLFALRARSLYDRAQALPAVSAERLDLKRQTERAEVTADSLFAGTVVLAVGSLLLALWADWEPALRPPDHASEQIRLRVRLLPAASPYGASLVLRGSLP